MDPNDMAQEWPMRHVATAVSGLKPITTMMGATTATGTPKPAIPCSKDVKHQDSKRHCNNLSSVTVTILAPMTLIAPDFSTTL